MYDMTCLAFSLCRLYSVLYWNSGSNKLEGSLPSHHRPFMFYTFETNKTIVGVLSIEVSSNKTFRFAESPHLSFIAFGVLSIELSSNNTISF